MSAVCLHGDLSQEQIPGFKKILSSRSDSLFGPDGLRHGSHVTVVRAPGRLDVMGGIADYCGSNVLEMPIDRAAMLAIQPRSDSRLVAVSLNARDAGFTPTVSLSVSDLFQGNKLKGYEEIRDQFREIPGGHWASYILGVPFVLLKEKAIRSLNKGFTVVLSSDIPMGSGVSSSAAVEMASMMAFLHETGTMMDPLKAATLAQCVENKVAGAPCGIMDQVAVMCGTSRQLLPILCQPASIGPHVPLPEKASILGVFTGARRSTAGGSYRQARVGAFMGLTLLVKDLGMTHLGSYLCRLTPQEFLVVKDRLPLIMSGRDFLNRVGRSLDRATTVCPDSRYRVRSNAEHPVYENDRVLRFAALMVRAGEANPRRRRALLSQAGQLMYASNWSYRNRVGLGSQAVDLLVDSLRKSGPSRGIYGAKITGGGGGGTVAVLCESSAGDRVEAALRSYEQLSGFTGDLFTGSSQGAQHFKPLSWAV